MGRCIGPWHSLEVVVALSLDAVGPLALMALRDQLQDGAREAAAELHRAGDVSLLLLAVDGNLFIIYLFSFLFTYILIYLCLVCSPNSMATLRGSYGNS